MCRSILLLIALASNVAYGYKFYRFPPYFKFGLATASYQVEGGWNASGKGENIWDRFTHEFSIRVKDHTTGDIACDSYHRWKEDVELLEYIGVNFYRFSISWSRLLPTGFTNKINPDGVRYYNNLIDELIKNKIEPMVTLYHWDLPQPLQDIGGMTNPLIADYFAEYARVAFMLFGDRVKKWITFNEPSSVCVSGYETGEYAPGISSPGIACYLCSKTVLLAHAKAYHIYNKFFRNSQKGKVGITIDSEWLEPKTNSSADIKAAERAIQMTFGWWMNPIFSISGDYPKVMKDRIASLSKAQNFSQSRLPKLSPSEVEFIKQTFDFLGLNHYTSKLVKAVKMPLSKFPSFEQDIGVKMEVDPKWKKSAASWLQVVPWGFRKLLNWIKERYDNPLIYVTENGYADTGDLIDIDRIEYHQLYMTELVKAIEDGCHVGGYAIWSLMDNMEWASGYTEKFGLCHVDFNSPNRTRTLKKSAGYYKDIIRNREMPKFTREY